MAYSYNVYTGNGSTTQFTIGFSYIRREHVKVYVAYVDTAYTYVNSTTVQLATAPGAGVRVEVRRVTPVASVLVDFADGSTLVAADLDTSNLQHLYIEQELDDANKQAIYVDPATGQLTAGGQQIKNVVNPTAAQDAATKAYVDDNALLYSGSPGFTQDGTGAVTRSWSSKLKDVVSIKDFGAVGDGTTNNQAAIQAALNTGKNVFIPDGIYRFNTAIAFAANGQSIYGSGNNSVLKQGAGGAYIYTSGYSNISLRDLKVDGTGASGGLAINSSSTDVLVSRVYWYEGQQRVWLFTCSSVKVLDCTFDTTGYGVIQQVANVSSYVLVSGNTAKNMTNDFVEANCASTAPSSNWAITNNIYQGAQGYPTAATEVRFVGITSVNGVVIDGNLVEKVAGDSAIHLEDTYGQTVISNNVFDNCLTFNQDGYIYLLNSAENTVISGNIFQRTNASLAAASAVWCSNNYDNTIQFTDNLVIGSAAGSNLSGFSLGFYSGQAVISGNIFKKLNAVINGSAASGVLFSGNQVVDTATALTQAVTATSTGYRDWTISNNVFTGTTGTTDVLTYTNSNGTGAPKRVYVTDNKFSKGVNIQGLPGGTVSSNSDSEDIQITNNIFGSAATLTTGGTMSRLVVRDNTYQATGATDNLPSIRLGSGSVISAPTSTSFGIDTNGSRALTATAGANIILGGTALPSLHSDSSLLKGISGLGAGGQLGKSICGTQSTVAVSGTADFNVGFYAIGLLVVMNELISNAAIRTHTTYSVFSRGGNAATFTQIATANGGTGGAAFSVAWTGSDTIRVTNSASGATNITVAYFGI